MITAVVVNEENRVVSILRVSSPAVLLAQTPPPGYRVIEASGELTLPASCYRVEHPDDSFTEVVPKDELTLTPSGATFAADGVTQGSIAVAGLTGTCQVAVNGYPLTVTPEDATIVLTSDARKRFTVTVNDPQYYAMPCTIKAV